MKKLIVAAMIAGSMMAMAEEAAKPAEAAKPTAVATPVRKQISAEQRAAMRAKFEQRIAARKAEMQKKALEIIKKYGLDDEKAKALLDELEAAMKPSRRPRPHMAKRPPKAAKPAAAPAKAE